MLPSLLPAFALAGLQHAPGVPQPYQMEAIMGSGIGAARFVAVEVDGQPELFCSARTDSFGPNDYWYALRRDPGTGAWTHSYVSELVPAGVVRMDAAEILPGRGITLVILLEDATVELRDPSSKALIGSFVSSAVSPTALELGDVTGDGYADILVLDSAQVVVHSAGGAVLGIGAAGGVDLVAAQMDDDPQPEIAVTSGVVLDALTLTAQWDRGGVEFGIRLASEDVDLDGRAELVAMQEPTAIRAYDVELQSRQWTIQNSTNDAISLTDVEGDGDWELLVGNGSSGDVRCFDALTTLEEWRIQKPETGVTDVIALDVDGDGDKEVIWATGHASTVSDHLYVADWQTQQIQWRSEHIDGPLVGPEFGDLDGDGLREIVVAGFKSESGYGSGRLMVLDAATLRTLAISPVVAGGTGASGIHDVRLRDVDRDGRDEILVGTDRGYYGALEIYDYDAGVFTLQWTNPMPWPDGSPFHSVEAADVDLDGDLELICGSGMETTGSLGNFVYVYDYLMVAEEWHSGQMGGSWDKISAVAVADGDMDGRPEIFAMVENGAVYVYDGVTKALEALLPGAFTAMSLQILGSTTVLLLGDQNGRVAAGVWNGASYQTVYERSLATVPIDGITPGPPGTVLLGADGPLRLVALASGAELWRSGPYGEGFGTRVLTSPLTTAPFVSAGRFSVVEFRL